MRQWTCERRYNFFSGLRFARHVFSLAGVGFSLILHFEIAVFFFSLGAIIGIYEHYIHYKYMDCSFGPPSWEQIEEDKKKLRRPSGN